MSEDNPGELKAAVADDLIEDQNTGGEQMSENTPETVDNPAVVEEADDTDMTAHDFKVAPSAADPDDGEGAVEETDEIEAGEIA